MVDRYILSLSLYLPVDIYILSLSLSGRHQHVASDKGVISLRYVITDGWRGQLTAGLLHPLTARTSSGRHGYTQTLSWLTFM